MAPRRTPTHSQAAFSSHTHINVIARPFGGTPSFNGRPTMKKAHRTLLLLPLLLVSALALASAQQQPVWQEDTAEAAVSQTR